MKSNSSVPAACLKLDGVVVGYNEPLIQPVSATISLGESTVIDGETGIGKTALLRAICGRSHVYSGTLFGLTTACSLLSEIQGDVSDFRVGVLWNDRQTLESLNVLQVLHLVGYDDSNGMCETKRRAKSLVSMSPLHKRLDTRVSALSGGERTMLCLACAILRARGGVLLIDDLAAGLQPKLLALAIEVLQSLIQDTLLGILYSDDHDDVRDRLASSSVTLLGFEQID